MFVTIADLVHYAQMEIALKTYKNKYKLKLKHNFTNTMRLKKETYVGTRIMFFTGVNMIKLPLYIYLSMVNFGTIYKSIALFPLSLLGIFIGYQMLKILEEDLFYNIIYALIFLASIKLILDFF